MTEKLVSGLRSFVRPARGILFLLLLFCLLPTLFYTAFARSVIGLFGSFVLVMGLVLQQWIPRLRKCAQQAEQNSEILCAELGRTIDDLNTAQKTLDETDRANRAAMLRLRHDLIGPLGSIAGFLQLLQDGGPPLSPRRLAFIENIERSVGNLISVAGRLEQQPDTGGLPNKLIVSCQHMSPAHENSGVQNWIKRDSGVRGRR